MRSIGAFGSVYTLSDRHYRPSVILFVLQRLADMGQYAVCAIWRPSHRMARIAKERDFINFARRFARVSRPGFHGFIRGDQAFNIRCSEGWWKIVVQMLMHSSDLVVMDISKVGVGSTWEIAQLFDRGLGRSTIFICQAGFEAQSLEALKTARDGTSSAEIFVYESNGKFIRPDAFNARLEAVLGDAIEHRRQGIPAAHDARSSVYDGEMSRQHGGAAE